MTQFLTYSVLKKFAWLLVLNISDDESKKRMFILDLLPNKRCVQDIHLLWWIE